MWLTKKTNCRDYTNELIERADQGILTWEQIARAALCYMSEDDVKDMAKMNELIEDEDDEEEEENEEDEDPECDGDDEVEYSCTLDGLEVKRVSTYDEAMNWLQIYDGDKDPNFEEVSKEN